MPQIKLDNIANLLLIDPVLPGLNLPDMASTKIDSFDEHLQRAAVYPSERTNPSHSASPRPEPVSRSDSDSHPGPDDPPKTEPARSQGPPEAKPREDNVESTPPEDAVEERQSPDDQSPSDDRPAGQADTAQAPQDSADRQDSQEQIDADDPLEDGIQMVIAPAELPAELSQEAADDSAEEMPQDVAPEPPEDLSNELADGLLEELVEELVEEPVEELLGEPVEEVVEELVDGLVEELIDELPEHSTVVVPKSADQEHVKRAVAELQPLTQETEIKKIHRAAVTKQQVDDPVVRPENLSRESRGGEGPKEQSPVQVQPVTIDIEAAGNTETEPADRQSSETHQANASSEAKDSLRQKVGQPGDPTPTGVSKTDAPGEGEPGELPTENTHPQHRPEPKEAPASRQVLPKLSGAPIPEVQSSASGSSPAGEEQTVYDEPPVSSARGDVARGQTTAKPVAANQGDGQQVAPVRSAPGTTARTRTPQQPAATTEGDGVDRVRFVQRVARAFQTMGQRNGSVRLRLSPPELGTLRMQISVREGMMTARVEAETITARNLLLDNLPALRDRLAQQDIKVQQFDVDLMDHSPGGLPDRTADQTPGQDGRDNQQSRESGGNADSPAETGSDSHPVLRTDEGTQLNVIV